MIEFRTTMPAPAMKPIGRLLRRYRRVVLDLGRVTRIDARGVGMLAALIAQANSTDRRLVLAASSRRVQLVPAITGLDVLLENRSGQYDSSVCRAEADQNRALPRQAVARA